MKISKTEPNVFMEVYFDCPNCEVYFDCPNYNKLIGDYDTSAEFTSEIENGNIVKCGCGQKIEIGCIRP